VNAGGTVQERYTYTPFGQVTFRDGSGSTVSVSAKDWVFLDQGGEKIAAGDYEFRNRVYSPSLGRWLSNDPIGFATGDVNTFRYEENNGLIWTDPKGLTKGGGKQHIRPSELNGQETPSQVDDFMPAWWKTANLIDGPLGRLINRMPENHIQAGVLFAKNAPQKTYF
jgi:RHS repeat-associated protein